MASNRSVFINDPEPNSIFGRHQQSAFEPNKKPSEPSSWNDLYKNSGPDASSKLKNHSNFVGHNVYAASYKPRDYQENSSQSFSPFYPQPSSHYEQNDEKAKQAYLNEQKRTFLEPEHFSEETGRPLFERGQRNPNSSHKFGGDQARNER